MAQLNILAGLRNLAKVVAEEIKAMPITVNLLENEVLGPLIVERLEKATQQGVQQGSHEGRVALLSKQLQKRFGSLPSVVQERLAQLSSSELDELSVRIFDAQSVDELFS